MNNSKMDTNTEAVTYADEGDKVTITIQGAALDNLRAITTAMNTTPWCDHDNRAEDILSDFIIGDTLLNLSTPVTKHDGISVCGVSEIATSILDCIDTSKEEGGEADKAKKAALSKAFEKAGVL